MDTSENVEVQYTVADASQLATVVKKMIDVADVIKKYIWQEFGQRNALRADIIEPAFAKINQRFYDAIENAEFFRSMVVTAKWREEEITGELIENLRNAMKEIEESMHSVRDVFCVRRGAEDDAVKFVDYQLNFLVPEVLENASAPIEPARPFNLQGASWMARWIPERGSVPTTGKFFTPEPR